MDNLYFKKLPSEILPTVSGADIVIAETASGVLYRIDSGGAKRLTDMDTAFPVNSRWIQFQGEPTPSARFGGSWVADTDYSGRTIVGSGTGYSLGATGGEATHTLTVDELPNHSHPLRLMGTTSDNVPLQPWVKAAYNSAETAGSTGFTGNDQPHNNMQPYKVVAIWKRTA